MAFNVTREVEWSAGAGTPVKYRFNINVNIEVLSITGTIATIGITGTYGVQNYPTNSRNSFAASDFAVLSKGDVDPWDYPFTPGVSYYQTALPSAATAPSSVVDGIIIEFRGDTWISDPVDNNNRSSLYDKAAGVVLNAYNGSDYQSFAINTTFTVDIDGGGDVPILTWVTSGANSSTSYSWLQHEVWASWFDLDYRPGATLDTDTSVWKSHNRLNGACHVLADVDDMTWQECRTVGGDIDAQGNSPLILHDANPNSWYNQKRLGFEG